MSQGPKEQGQAGACPHPGREYALVLLVALAWYAFGAAPGLLWQDSGLIQYRLWHGDVEGRLGLALAHPLFYYLGMAVKALPLGSFPARVNLISAVAAAVAVANVYLLLRWWRGAAWVAAVGALSLALSHTFWRHASILETYTLNLAFFTGELLLVGVYLQRRQVRWLYGLALLNGLAVANHLLAALPLMCCLVWLVSLTIRRELRWRHWAVLALAWFAGASPYLVLIAQAWQASGDAAATLRSALFGSQWQQDVLNTSMSWTIVKQNLLFFGLNFPTPNIVLVPLGVVLLARAARRDALAALIVAAGVLFLLFAGRYTVPDRYAFFIPFYAVTALAVAIGAHAVGRSCGGGPVVAAVLVGMSCLPVVVYAVAPGLARAAGVSLGTRRSVPYRDEYRFFLQPWKHGYRGADRFAAEALAQAGPQGVIFADSTTAYPLLVAQDAYGWGADVAVYGSHYRVGRTLLDDTRRLDELARQGRLWVVSALPGYAPPELLERYDFETVDGLSRARPR